MKKALPIFLAVLIVGVAGYALFGPGAAPQDDRAGGPLSSKRISSSTITAISNSTSTFVLGANSARRWATLQNLSTSTAMCAGRTAAGGPTSTYAWRINADGGTFVLNDDLIWQGGVACYSTAQPVNLGVTEATNI